MIQGIPLAVRSGRAALRGAQHIAHEGAATVKALFFLKNRSHQQGAQKELK
jgi:hypothetical protein